MPLPLVLLCTYIRLKDKCARVFSFYLHDGPPNLPFVPSTLRLLESRGRKRIPAKNPHHSSGVLSGQWWHLYEHEGMVRMCQDVNFSSRSSAKAKMAHPQCVCVCLCGNGPPSWVVAHARHSSCGMSFLPDQALMCVCVLYLHSLPITNT